jgi:deaminated glutathione amidase
MAVMRVGLLQVAAGEDKDANRDAVVAGVRELAGAGAQLIVAPEASMHGFGAPDLLLAPVAEPLEGPFVTALAAAAKEHGVTVLAGMFEPVEGDPSRAYNTVVAVGPDGALIGRYRKQHLFDALGWVESDRLESGDPEDRLVFTCADLTVGVMTCYDLRFPELARALVDDGCELIAVPSAWVAGPLKEDQWTTLVRARAIENVVYVAAADQPAPAYAGRTLVVDPFGVVVSSLGEGPGRAVADVDPDRVAECRKRMPSLLHRRWSVTPR